MSRGVRSFSDAFAGYRKHPHAVAQSLLVGAAGWGFNLLALSVAARAIGVDLSWTVLAVCIPITLLVALAPFSINGLGLREGVLVALLSHSRRLGRPRRRDLRAHRPADDPVRRARSGPLVAPPAEQPLSGGARGRGCRRRGRRTRGIDACCA